MSYFEMQVVRLKVSCRLTFNATESLVYGETFSGKQLFRGLHLPIASAAVVGFKAAGIPASYHGEIHVPL